LFTKEGIYKEEKRLEGVVGAVSGETTPKLRSIGIYGDRILIEFVKAN